MITVPKSALSQPGEGSDESVTPGIGDEVDLGGVKAKVTAENGDNVDLDVVSVNGVPVVGEGNESDAPDNQDDAAAGINSSVAGQDEVKTALIKKLMARDRKAGL